MNFELSQQQKETQEWARAFAREVITPHSIKHSREKISLSVLESLFKAGWMTLTVPVSMGGLELDSISFALAIKELSKVCGSTGVTVAVTNMVADVLVREGNSYHHSLFLAPLIQGKFFTASFCLTENQSGSDARSLKTSAHLSGDNFVLNGEKLYVTNGAYSGFFLVMAKEQESGLLSAYGVMRDTEGFKIGKEEEKMGLVGSSTLRLSLDQVKVPKLNQVGASGEGFKIAMRALDRGRISVASQALGIAEGALEAGISYAKDRVAFGHPIADFQAIQWKLADAKVSLSASELLILRAAYLKDQKLPFTREASMAKVYATETACRVCDDMIQIHGGYGYVKDYPVERYFRDVRVTTLYEGTSEIQRMVISREILK